MGATQRSRRGYSWMHRPWERPSGREVGAANFAAAGLYLAGGALTATWPLLPHVDSPAAITSVGFVAILTASALLLAARAGRGGLRLAFVADLWGTVLIFVLCAASGGARSPFAILYLFAVGHAAAFQPRSRLGLAMLFVLLGFLAPLAYESVPAEFGAVVCMGVVLSALTAGFVHFALDNIRSQRRRLKLMLSATASLNASLDPTETVRDFARAAIPDLADVCVVDLLDQEGLIMETVAAAPRQATAAELERVAMASPLPLLGPHPIAQTLRSGEPCVSGDLAQASELGRFARSEEHRRLMSEIGYRAVAVFPMIARGRTWGAISFVHVNDGEYFGPDDMAVLGDMSQRVAMAFDNAHLYAERSRTASTLRRSLMPALLPSFPGLELASYFRPMAGSEVGGDFYDVFGSPQSCWLIVGDVCGKGAEAATLTGFLRATTVAYAREAPSPATVLYRVNQVMLERGFDGRFATAILAHLRALETGVEVAVASAGHPAALLARAEGEVREFGDRGTLLGVFEDPVIDEATTVLEPGDALSLYTDGLLEAHTPDDVITADEAIERLQQLKPRGAEETIATLLGLVDLESDVRDDIAILSARVRGAGMALSGAERGAASTRAAR